MKRKGEGIEGGKYEGKERGKRGEEFERERLERRGVGERERWKNK